MTCSHLTAKASQSQTMANSYIPSPLLIRTAWQKTDLAQIPQIGQDFQDIPENGKSYSMSYVNNLRTFVRVYELGSMSAAGRDQRVSAAVASARLADLERHLGVRLFNRTTRSLQPTEQGSIFYKGALKILETIEEAEAAVADVSRSPRGSLHVAAPLGIGKRLIAPLIPAFKDFIHRSTSDCGSRTEGWTSPPRAWTSRSCSACWRILTCASDPWPIAPVFSVRLPPT